MNKVITRYAPSPTGDPHVGNIRTAIFAYLWAKHNRGKFLLRIEDTDQERLVPESLKSIEDSLKWLGIEYSSEVIYQSDRRVAHLKLAQQLVSNGKAYKCFCTKERLEKLREQQTKSKQPPGYDGLCSKLSNSDIEKHEIKGDSYVIRFRMPQTGKAKWLDGIRGNMSIDYTVSDDPIIIKSDGWPTYHLASVVDDHETKVTDVIRGEEWISSTPKHIALYNAFGWEPPRFSHMPHINGPDGSKLSKRHGDTAVLDYREKGYLPEAMFNFLVLLGWNDGTEKEIFTKDELIESFDISRIGKSPSVFDIEKLKWMNGIYIRNMDNKLLLSTIVDLNPDSHIVKLPNFNRILEVEKSRLSTLCDITKDTDFYVKNPKYNPELLIFKKSSKEATREGLRLALSYFSLKKWEDDITKINDGLSKMIAENKLSNGDVFWPVRVALSGQEKSASPAELLWIFGKDESISRIKLALKELDAI